MKILVNKNCKFVYVPVTEGQLVSDDNEIVEVESLPEDFIALTPGSLPNYKYENGQFTKDNGFAQTQEYLALPYFNHE